MTDNFKSGLSPTTHCLAVEVGARPFCVEREDVGYV